MDKTTIDATDLAAALRSLRPDRGNRYATRTVRVKGAAAFRQWEVMCRELARKVSPTGRRLAEFFEACGLNEQ